MVGGARPSLGALFEHHNPNGNGRTCTATPIVPAGGAFVNRLLHPDFVPFQMNFRALPQSGMMTASRQRPLQFTLGAFTVPKSMALGLGEYRFRPYRFEGLVPGDAVPVEDYRLSLEIGNDVLMNNQSRPGNIRLQIIPAVPPAISPSNAGLVNGGVVFPPLTVQNFTNVAAAYPALEISNQSNQLVTDPSNPRQFVSTLSGASVIPQRPEGHLGPDNMPFTYFVEENQAVVLQTAIFAPVRIPIAFFEGELKGYLMPINVLRAMMQAVKPCS